jgi:transposase
VVEWGRTGGMQDVSLYQQLLGLSDPWFVASVKLDVANVRVDIEVEHRKGATWTCPVCGRGVQLYDHAEQRTWRHLDSCQFKTYLHARVPRVGCPEHGILNATLPWGERGSRFTMLMERLIIAVLLQSYTVSAACRLLGISWDEAHGVMIRAVRRGLARRGENSGVHIAVDEKLVRRGHKYVTVVCDLDRSAVLYVSQGRESESLAGYYRGLSEQQRNAIQAVALDMSQPYVKATRENLPEGEDKIVFDRFHIMKLANEALDRVRQQECAILNRQNNPILKQTKQMWLWAEENLPAKHQDRFAQLKQLDLKTSVAWAMKENLRRLWEQPTLTAGRDHLVHWIEWVNRAAIKPMLPLAKTLRQQMPKVLNYLLHPISTNLSEGINSKIQAVKHKAAGYRNTFNFIQAIYFFCGKLDLDPR